MNTDILASQIEALNATPARNADVLRTRNATIAKLRQQIDALEVEDLDARQSYSDATM
jgi:hypothetical protein